MWSSCLKYTFIYNTLSQLEQNPISLFLHKYNKFTIMINFMIDVVLVFGNFIKLYCIFNMTLIPINGYYF